MAESKRTVGPVTVAAGGGSVVGYAAATVIVWILAQLGVDAAEIEDAIAVLLTVAGTVLGGWLVKPGTGKRAIE
ncbi:hypothetical protein AA310_01825 [Arthrobacter sp. YC-RL1]|uniref:hypothetical protein n=1 Tax=Arthrobacter sp. YC-RL1 TaxID=1652545 RepID=UPI00063DA7C4|nr:hypothetical protein [Arthrobacter sp. YC-RL1]ALQ31832.1 hypothetical protein ATC04_15635 [Arthrobacter sp. YC-RL1]KLI90146.1 hypothetical protein AA310_01825 [Arthrobacter sp. YC-RL1]